MRESEFTKNKSGQLVQTPRGYWAFVPDPLPPKIGVTWELASQLSDADRALSELAGIARTLPNPHLLIAPFIRREAVLSSRIEGTQASLSELFFFEAAGIEPSPNPDVREVANYVRALEHGLARLADLPISLRLIREMHAQLMDGVRGDEMSPGEFRQDQNWIGAPGARLSEAIYVPPPVDEMLQALDQLEKYLHTSSNFPPLVRLALIHYQFEAIHPFRDGNGRIGRLLITLLLCAEKLLPQPLLYLSAFFERHRNEYYDLLLSISQKGVWTEWIRFFLQGVTEQSRDAIARSKRLQDVWQSHRKKMQTARASGTLLQIIDDLIRFPVITVPQTATQLDVTYKSALKNIEKLVDAGILKEAKNQPRPRTFYAPSIIDILEMDKAN